MLNIMSFINTCLYVPYFPFGLYLLALDSGNDRNNYSADERGKCTTAAQ
jgi:hypothetical protein